jgi:arabinogalactan endo-1,4-beta-galactosidase
MKTRLFSSTAPQLFLAVCLLAVFLPAGKAADISGYVIGADMSFVKEKEGSDASWKDTDGQQKPVLQIPKNHGYNRGRVMIWSGSDTGNYGPNNTTAIGKRFKDMGCKVLLDFTCAGTWTNWGTQTIPAAWTGKTHVSVRQTQGEVGMDVEM